MIYEPLTKKVSDIDGNVKIVCRYCGTSTCHIHKPSGCSSCPVFNAILTQLNMFEEIYQEEDDEDGDAK